MIRLHEEISVELQCKLDKLEDYLRSLGSLAVGFSGGVDSSFLLAVANEVLGDRVKVTTDGRKAALDMRLVDPRVILILKYTSTDILLKAEFSINSNNSRIFGG